MDYHSTCPIDYYRLILGLQFNFESVHNHSYHFVGSSSGSDWFDAVVAAAGLGGRCFSLGYPYHHINYSRISSHAY